MKKQIVVISSSLRLNSNSNILADEFIKGALNKGHTVEKIDLKNKTINYCKGCFACAKTNKCVIKDDSNEIIEKMKNADVIVFATPIYFYSISGQLKTLLDRTNPLYASDYKFKDIYLLLTAADDANNAKDGSIKAIQGWVDCFDGVTLKDVIFAGGVNNPKEITNHASLKLAYDLGLNI